MIHVNYTKVVRSRPLRMMITNQRLKNKTYTTSCLAGINKRYFFKLQQIYRNVKIKEFYRHSKKYNEFFQ